MALKLTARQSQILDLIRQAIAVDGRPPTRAEIADTLGFRSANAAEDHLRALARKGVIRLSAGTSRGIQLVEANEDATQALRRAPRDHAPDDAPPVRLAQAADHLLLPIVGRVAAGHPILAAEHVEREIPVGAGLFSQTPDYLLRVRGASMRDVGILDGDLLAVRRSPEARNGQIVVARLGTEVTVKRLERQGGRLRLLPENPDFQPILVGPGDDFALEGIAVGLIRTDALH
ncbi:transcriptional repressor LexA [Castellaniella sp. GW247-6E4]|uniref:transcriptional repressor LexA n=1 Tax=Castellaniella sp. GW247-6E4 TaxID=3140380 RepID=UPI003314E1D9